MIKNYVLDTNVLLLDPQSIFTFDDNNVIIPIGVIEELDTFKKDQNELGKNARQVSRFLDELRKKGDLRKGVSNGQGHLMVRYNGNLDSFYKELHVDLHVIHIAQKMAQDDPNKPCIIVSRDINVRIRANALGLNAENYENDQIANSPLDKGHDTIFIPLEKYQKLVSQDELSLDEIEVDSSIKIYPNHYFLVKSDDSGKSGFLARIDSECNNIKGLIASPAGFGLTAKNKEQSFVLDALLDNSIKLVCISGKAGSGKTILSLAVGYHLAVKTHSYKRLLVSRPVFPMGKDIGYLPGDINEKLDPWMTPIYDAFDVINNYKHGSGKHLVDGSNVIVEPLTYIRGRSIREQFLIIDEAQNLNLHEIKTIITRAGEHTKVILTGDIDQIDNPYIDGLSNGLSVVTSSMKDSSLTANISLAKGVRSALAEEASNKL